MKTQKLVLSILMIAFISFSALAGKEKATIKTSAQCEMCKTNIETALAKVEGVKKATLNIETKEVEVVFKDDVTDLKTIKLAIADAGYNADDFKANPIAKRSLAACCQPKKSCCASKSSCSKDKAATTTTSAKSCCSKDASKKTCSKDAQKTSCSKDASKKTCSKDANKKACSHGK